MRLAETQLRACRQGKHGDYKARLTGRIGPSGEFCVLVAAFEERQCEGELGAFAAL